MATWSPLPQNLASSSMPSSWMTVESTSKQTASASLQTIFTSSRFAILPEQTVKVQKLEANIRAPRKIRLGARIILNFGSETFINHDRIIHKTEATDDSDATIRDSREFQLMTTGHNARSLPRTVFFSFLFSLILLFFPRCLFSSFSLVDRALKGVTSYDWCAFPRDFQISAHSNALQEETAALSLPEFSIAPCFLANGDFPNLYVSL